MWPRFKGFRGFKEQEKVLTFDRPLAGRFLGLTGLWPEGCGIAFGDEYIVSVAYYPYRLPLVILSDSEGSRYLQHMRQKLLNTVLQKEPLDDALPLWCLTAPLSHLDLKLGA